MKTIAPLVPLIAILLLAGCSKEKDVAYYKANQEERGKRLAECDKYNDSSQDCRNAEQAQMEAYAAPVSAAIPASAAVPPQ